MVKPTQDQLNELRDKRIIIERHEYGFNNFVSTILAYDTKKYETGVFDVRFGDHDTIILQEYETEAAALIGHKKWVDVMMNPKTKYLRNVSTSIYDNHGYRKLFINKSLVRQQGTLAAAIDELHSACNDFFTAVINCLKKK